uniref:F-box associated beta-propeller type 3 domain-containing protein n=1 Tax=Oryza punctata TaxID=4537 RepID=A0A0E0MC23_ORYPU
MTTVASRPSASSLLSVTWAVTTTSTWMSWTTVSKPSTSASVARFTSEDYDFSLGASPFNIHASCDGLLLMACNNYLHLCNPTTQICLGPEFYVSTVGSGKERSIWPHSSSASLRRWSVKGKEDSQFNKPFLFHGNLHWLPQLGGQNKIVVFDTLDEVFRWLHVPFKMHNVLSLLEIEGSLAMSNSHIGSSKLDLWFLQDYKHMVWVHKYRIELPVIEIRRFEEDDGWCSHIVSQEGDVLVDGFDWQFHYDIKGNLLEKFQCNGRLLNFTSHVLQESLVQHEVFQILDNERIAHGRRSYADRKSRRSGWVGTPTVPK